MSPRKKQKKSRRDYCLIQQVAINIKKYRIQMNLTQEQLQENTQLAVFRYESGKHDMTLSSISILSEHLQVDPWQLLVEIETNKKEPLP